MHLLIINRRIWSGHLTYRKFFLIHAVILVFFSNGYAQSVNRKVAKRIKSFYDTVVFDSVKVGYKEFKIGTKIIGIYGTNHTIKDIQDPEFLGIEEQVNRLSPSLILTEGFGGTGVDKQEIVNWFGESGFCKYLAFKKSIEVNNWDRYWGHSYYDLVKKFKEEEIFISLFGLLLDEYHPPGDVKAFESYYKYTLSILENGGYPLTDKQKQPSYFYEQYRKHFGQPFQLVHTAGDVKELAAKWHRGIDRDIFSYLLQKRDLSLLKTIKESLATHDRIFIQCGSYHRASMEKVINQVMNLEAAKSSKSLKHALQEQLSSDDTVHLSNNIYVKTFNIKNKKVIIWATKQKIDFLNDSTVSKMEDIIHRLSPSLILATAYKPIDSTAEKTYRRYGDEGLCRFVAQKSKIHINVWSKYWSYSYYKIASEYSDDKIFCCALFNYMNKYINSYKSNFKSLQEYFEYIATRLDYEGYPRRYTQINFNVIYEQCREDVPDMPYDRQSPVKNIEYVVRRSSLRPIIDDFEKRKYEELLSSLAEKLEKNNRIFVQADWDYVKQLYN
jgi:hypothetical protein